MVSSIRFKNSGKNFVFKVPEAQLDRFMMRIRVGYPDESAERTMLTRFHQRAGATPTVTRTISAEELTALQQGAASVTCDASVVEYAMRLVRATRKNTRLRLGASPRAGQSLLAAAKARAALEQKAFVTPDQVKQVIGSVLNHRLIMKAEAEVDGVTADDVIRQTLEQVEVPR